jgi:hypothetical protein
MKKLLTLTLLFFAHFIFAQEVDYRLYFQNETILLNENKTTFLEKNDFVAADFFEGKAYRLMQFNELPNAKTRQKLAREGVSLLDYLPERAYIAVFKEQAQYDFLRKYNIRAISKLKTEWKINKALLPTAFGDWAMHNEYEEILLQCFEDVSFSAALQTLEKEGVTVTKQFPTRKFLYAKVKVREIQRIANLPFIWHLDVVPPAGIPDDSDSRALHESNQIDNEFSNDLRINGDGVRVQVRDDGTVGPHIDFKGRLTELSRYNNSLNHGDMVTGCVGGAGNLNPKMKGIATGAHFFITEYDATFTDTTIGLHKYHQVMVTNTSYTDGCNRYTTNSQTIDIQLFENPKLIHVFSAGNNNGEGIVKKCGYGVGTQWGNITGGHKQGKNCITAANIDDNMALAPSSSRGPAHDGRLKPEVSAHGTDVNTTFPDNAYTVNTGTSFSAPFTAGILAVMYQAYRMENQGKDPDGALMKAILLNTATEIGNYGPDYKYGWGVANTQRAVEAIQNQQFAIDSLDQGDDKKILVRMPGNIKLAKIMLVWSDFPSAPTSKKALVNDLDLSVTAPNGTVLLPFKLDPTPTESSLDAPATRGRDSLNNVEQVAIENPVGGAIYEVHIKGYNVPKGVQTFYLAYEFFEEDFKPIDMKKEGFFTGERIPARWITTVRDTSLTVYVSLSTDNGNNWTSVGNAKAILTHLMVTLPKINTDKARFKFKVGDKEYETSKFSICTQPNALSVTKICPDSISFSWTPITAPVGYEIMMLGDKQMQPLGKTSATSITLPLPPKFFKEKENWFTVRTVFDTSGMIGKRRNAVSVQTGLINCPLAKDIVLNATLQSPQNSYSSQCISSLEDSIAVTIKNQGLDSIGQVKMSYQYDNQTVVTEDFDANLKSGQSQKFVFKQKIKIEGIGAKKLKIWTNLDGDQLKYNDSLSQTINSNLLDVSNISEKFDYVQDFNGLKTEFPYGWGSFSAQKDNANWGLTNMVSSNGKRSDVMAINFLLGNTNTSDELYTIPVTIDSNASSPKLLFDVAYGFVTSDASSDRLQVVVYENCERSGGNIKADLVGRRLSTENRGGTWLPTKASSWRTEIVDLSEYKGKKVTVGFKAQNKKQSILFLDNVRFQNFTPTVTAKAEIIASSKEGCVLDTIYYSAKNTDLTYGYQWTFQGGDRTSAVGPGPIQVIYNTASTNNKVTLIQRTPLETSTNVIENIKIYKPVSRFAVTRDTLTVTCVNQSTDATSYLWNFGDNTTSTEKDPIHTYAKAGDYFITLTAYSICGEVKSTRKVTITVGVNDIFEQLKAEILPNPNDGNFELVVDNQYFAKANVKIIDVAGKTLWTKAVDLNEGIQRIKVNKEDLQKGMYFLQIESQEKRGSLKLVIW